MKLNTFLKLAFAAYIVFIFVFVVVKLFDPYLASGREYWLNERRAGRWANINLIPFGSYNVYYFKDILKDILSVNALKNIAANLLVYSPLSCFILYFSKNKSFAPVMFKCFCFILSVELFQFITLLGVFDVDDILMNMIGCVIGWFAYLAIKRFLRWNKKVNQSRRHHQISRLKNPKLMTRPTTVFVN